MKIAVCAQEQELRVHLAAAVLERPELEVHVLPIPDLLAAGRIGASVILLQAPTGRTLIGEPELRQLAHAIPLIVVCKGVDRVVAANYLRVGARGILLAERGTKTFQSAIFAIADGGSWIDPIILSELLRVGAPELLDLRGVNERVAAGIVAAKPEHSTGRPSRGSNPASGSGVNGDAVNANGQNARSSHRGSSDGAAAHAFVSAPLHASNAGTSGGRANGNGYEGPGVAQDVGSQHKRLTGRESQVAGLIGRGLTNSEIATCLGVDESTVKTHIGSILRKIHLRDRLQIALWFHGLPIGNDDASAV